MSQLRIQTYPGCKRTSENVCKKNPICVWRKRSNRTDLKSPRKIDYCAATSGGATKSITETEARQIISRAISEGKSVPEMYYVSYDVQSPDNIKRRVQVLTPNDIMSAPVGSFTPPSVSGFTPSSVSGFTPPSVSGFTPPSVSVGGGGSGASGIKFKPQTVTLPPVLASMSTSLGSRVGSLLSPITHPSTEMKTGVLTLPPALASISTSLGSRLESLLSPITRQSTEMKTGALTQLPQSRTVILPQSRTVSLLPETKRSMPLSTTLISPTVIRHGLTPKPLITEADYDRYYAQFIPPDIKNMEKCQALPRDTIEAIYKNLGSPRRFPPYLNEEEDPDNKRNCERLMVSLDYLLKTYGLESYNDIEQCLSDLNDYNRQLYARGVSSALKRRIPEEFYSDQNPLKLCQATHLVDWTEINDEKTNEYFKSYDPSVREWARTNIPEIFKQ